MPSPVPTLCSRKSPKGWNVFEPSAGDTVSTPPLITVPAGAVVSVRTWHVAHPIESKSVEPRTACDDAARMVSRAGALVARMNRAKRSMSASPLASLSRSEEHTSELQSQFHLVCRLLLEKKKKKNKKTKNTNRKNRNTRNSSNYTSSHAGTQRPRTKTA